jgi:hypothetical protein
MTPEEIEKDRKIIEAATEGPWITYDIFVSDYNPAIPVGIETVNAAHIADTHIDAEDGPSEVADAAFIAAARIRWPEALNEIDRLTQRVKELEETIQRLEKR